MQGWADASGPRKRENSLSLQLNSWLSLHLVYGRIEERRTLFATFLFVFLLQRRFLSPAQRDVSFGVVRFWCLLRSCLFLSLCNTHFAVGKKNKKTGVLRYRDWRRVEGAYLDAAAVRRGTEDRRKLPPGTYGRRSICHALCAIVERLDGSIVVVEGRRR